MYQIKGSDLIGPKEWMFEPIKCQGHFAVAKLDFSDVVLDLYLHKWAVTCIWSSPYNILDLNLDSESPIHLKSVPCDVLQGFQTVISLILSKNQTWWKNLAADSIPLKNASVISFCDTKFRKNLNICFLFFVSLLLLLLILLFLNS